jgi:hypothetical protein
MRTIPTSLHNLAILTRSPHQKKNSLAAFEASQRQPFRRVGGSLRGLLPHPGECTPPRVHPCWSLPRMTSLCGDQA